VLSATRSSQEQREWVRVPAALDVKVKHTSGSRRYFDPECRTRDLSGGGVGIFSSRPPPPGESVEFTLDLKDRPPLSLRGVVVRVEPPIAYGEPALVGVKLGPIAETDRDAVVRWVARESTRAAARAREGRVCPVCGRTLADPALEVHPGCVGKESKRPKRL
jgi:hypothetical protein